MLGLVPHRRRELSADYPVSSPLELAERFFSDFVPSFRREGADLLPTFDISETDGHILVKADLPGIDAGDLDISISENVLTVKGERTEEHEEKGEQYYCSERRFGSFARSFVLPTHVDADGIEASYKDGVLKLSIPKIESAKQKKIEVKVVH